ncbi:MAG: hypothetical protein IV101_14675 [Dechloromonas sp.]|uniref:hypothetical protein n=1 Tax=Dechloromonas sp. TaxID=1917218 RepID=UPI0027F24A63|nr:hypothetical protein [Dechloromonas sp.]MBT9522121.1 hypothetical protein [Dechloromonas sp.]
MLRVFKLAQFTIGEFSSNFLDIRLLMLARHGFALLWSVYCLSIDSGMCTKSRHYSVCRSDFAIPVLILLIMLLSLEF